MRVSFARIDETTNHERDTVCSLVLLRVSRIQRTKSEINYGCARPVRTLSRLDNYEYNAIRVLIRRAIRSDLLMAA